MQSQSLSETLLTGQLEDEGHCMRHLMRYISFSRLNIIKVATVFILDTAILAVVLPVPYFILIAHYGDTSFLTSTAFQITSNQVSPVL